MHAQMLSYSVLLYVPFVRQTLPMSGGRAGPLRPAYPITNCLIRLRGLPFRWVRVIAGPSYSTLPMMAGISQYPMPPQTADIATAWVFLEEGVDHIMTKLQTGVSHTRYMSLYTVAYNYCTSSDTSVAGLSPSLTFRLLRADLSLQPVLI
jgi:hypothetical protein